MATQHCLEDQLILTDVNLMVGMRNVKPLN